MEIGFDALVPIGWVLIIMAWGFGAGWLIGKRNQKD